MYRPILIAGTVAVALATVYSLIHSEPNSFTSGFVSGFGALLAFDLWLDE